MKTTTILFASISFLSCDINEKQGNFTNDSSVNSTYESFDSISIEEDPTLFEKPEEMLPFVVTAEQVFFYDYPRQSLTLEKTSKYLVEHDEFQVETENEMPKLYFSEGLYFMKAVFTRETTGITTAGYLLFDSFSFREIY